MKISERHTMKYTYKESVFVLFFGKKLMKILILNSVIIKI